MTATGPSWSCRLAPAGSFGLHRGCSQGLPSPPLPGGGRASPHRGSGLGFGFILALPRDLREVSSPLWAQRPHLKNGYSGNRGLGQAPSSGIHGGGVQLRRALSSHRFTVILTVFSHPPNAGRDEVAASASPALSLGPRLPCPDQIQDQIQRPPSPSGAARTELMDMFFARKKSWRNCILPKVSAQRENISCLSGEC